MMAANTIEPPVGASTCASGNQVWTGHIGTLTAKAIKNAMKINTCSLKSNCAVCQDRTSKVSVALYKYKMATKVNKDPIRVYRKNLNAA